MRSAYEGHQTTATAILYQGQQLMQGEAEDHDHQYAYQATCARVPSSASNKDMCYIAELVIKELLR